MAQVKLYMGGSKLRTLKSEELAEGLCNTYSMKDDDQVLLRVFEMCQAYGKHNDDIPSSFWLAVYHDVQTEILERIK